AGARAGGDSGSTARLRPSGELRAAPGLRPPGDRRRRSEPDDSPPTQISPAARPIARFPRPPAHRYTQPGRSYGPPVPGGSEPEEAVDGQPVAPAAATAATAPTPPATPRQGEPAPSRPPVESPTEVVEAVGRRPSGSTLSQLVARSRRARTVDPAAAEPPALLDAEASSTAPAGETSTPARPSRSRGGAAALASGTSLRTAIPAVRPTRPRAGDEALSDSGRGNGTRRPGPGGSGSPGKGAEAGNGQAGSAAADDEALQATRVFAPASLQGTPAPPTTKRGDLDAPEDLDAAGAPGDEAWPGEVDVTGDRHGTVLGGVDLSGNEEPQAVPIVFDFDELAEPPLAAIPVRPIRGLRPPGGGKKALRVVTGAATVAVLAAGGALIWDLATKTGPGHAPSASKSSAGSATKATITPRHATAGRTRTSVPPKQVTHPSVPAPSTTAPSATLTPLSSNQSLTVYRAPTGRYTLAFKVSSGDCWVGAEIAGTYTWMETIYPDTPASYATRGTVTVRIGAPSVLSVSVNGKPVTLPANSQPYDIEFATAAPAQSGTAVPAKSGTAAPAKSGTAAPAK
ncbi:MAG TPA: RodZ domain-containing protein, partial [Acidimicrobiales bacterium]|nr:RodZ domain-containing protein [Acidimicrobiales bacterium]